MAGAAEVVVAVVVVVTLVVNTDVVTMIMVEAGPATVNVMVIVGVTVLRESWISGELLTTAIV